MMSEQKDVMRTIKTKNTKLEKEDARQRLRHDRGFSTGRESTYTNAMMVEDMWKKSEWKKQLASSVPKGLKVGLKAKVEVGVVKGDSVNIPVVGGTKGKGKGKGKGKAEEEVRRPEKAKAK